MCLTRPAPIENRAALHYPGPAKADLVTRAR